MGTAMVVCLPTQWVTTNSKMGKEEEKNRMGRAKEEAGTQLEAQQKRGPNRSERRAFRDSG